MKFHVRMYLSLFFCMLVLFLSTSARTEETMANLPDGQAMLSLSATERREVQQDQLVANLTYSALNADARAVQNEINTAMHKAVELAKNTQSVRNSTGAYQVYEITEPKSKERKWRGSQTIILKSRDSQAILDLVAKLQDLKLTVDGMNYQLDPKTSADIQDSLMEDALKQLQGRADRAAKALGKSSAVLRDIVVQGAGLPYSVPLNSHYAMRLDAPTAKAAPPPIAEAGDTIITLTVTARALLKP